MVDVKELCADLSDELGVDGVLKPASDVSERVYVPTGIYSFDQALQGIPKGQYTSIEGHPGTYKTTFAMRMCNQFESVLYMDTEHRVDVEWMARHCDTEKVVLGQPRNMEETYNIIKRAAFEHMFDLIVIDSISMIAPLDEVNRDLGESKGYAERARLTNAFFRNINVALGLDGSPTVVGINHLTSTMNTKPWGKDYDIPCGRQQGYVVTLRILLRHSNKISDDDDDKDIIGENIQWLVQKRSVPGTKNIGSFATFNRSGTYNGREVNPGDVDEFESIVHGLIEDGVLERRGSWYTINGEKIQGEKNVRPKVIELVDGMYRRSLGGEHVIEE